MTDGLLMRQVKQRRPYVGKTNEEIVDEYIAEADEHEDREVHRAIDAETRSRMIDLLIYIETIKKETTNGKFVVTDPDSGEVVGPFDSKDEAKAYFIAMANQEGWPDVLELVEKTGKPFVEDGDEFVFIQSRSENLVLSPMTTPNGLTEPSARVRSQILY